MSARPRSMLAHALAVCLIAGGSGLAALSSMASSPAMPSFGQRYGNNPRSTGNGGNGRGARASKRRPP